MVHRLIRKDFSTKTKTVAAVMMVACLAFSTARRRAETKGQGATSAEEGITVETTTLEFTLDL